MTTLKSGFFKEKACSWPMCSRNRWACVTADESNLPERLPRIVLPHVRRKSQSRRVPLRNTRHGPRVWLPSRG